jgi:hypothetical protein
MLLQLVSYNYLDKIWICFGLNLSLIWISFDCVFMMDLNSYGYGLSFIIWLNWIWISFGLNKEFIWNLIGILKLDWKLKITFWVIGLEFNIRMELIFNLDLDLDFNWIEFGVVFSIGLELDMDLKLVHGYLELNLNLLVYGKWSGIKLDNEIDLIYSGIGFHCFDIK